MRLPGQGRALERGNSGWVKVPALVLPVLGQAQDSKERVRELVKPERRQAPEPVPQYPPIPQRVGLCHHSFEYLSI